MNRISAVVVMAMSSAACSTAPATLQEPPASFLAVVNTNIIDVDAGRVIPAQTVLIRDGLIVETGPATSVRFGADATVIDGSGRFLIPGLWDMHVHTLREGRAPLFFPLFVANGVTSVREMGTFLDSLDFWKAKIAGGMLAPRIAAAGHIVNGAPPAGVTSPPPGEPTPAWVFALAAETPAAARAAVDTIVARDVDFVKVYSELPREAYFAAAEAAKAHGIPFAGHIPFRVTAAEAADAGQRTVEHLTGIIEFCVSDWENRLQPFLALLQRPDAATDSVRVATRAAARSIAAAYSAELCNPLFAKFREKDTYQSPTLVILRGLGRREEASALLDPRLRYMPAKIRSRWEPNGTDSIMEKIFFDTQVMLVREMHRSGVPIIAGTDASDEAYVFPGFSLHEELELLVSAGMTPLDALRAATINAARAVMLEGNSGTIAPGMRADLVLLDANPLDDIRNTQKIRAVILNGRHLDRAALDALLADAERMAKAPTN